MYAVLPDLLVDKSSRNGTQALFSAALPSGKYDLILTPQMNYGVRHGMEQLLPVYDLNSPRCAIRFHGTKLHIP